MIRILSFDNGIGAAFEWAKTKSRAGPKPKRLRIDTADRTLDELLEDVRGHYRGGAD